MPTFEQKQTSTPQTTSTQSSTLSPSLVLQNQTIGSILNLQRAIGNQAVQRLLQPNAGNPKPSSNATANNDITPGLSRVPVQSETQITIQNQPAEEKMTPTPKLGDLLPADSIQYEPASMELKRSENGQLMKRAAEQLTSYHPDESTLQHWRHKSEGIQLPGSNVGNWSNLLGSALPPVYVHQDEFADRFTSAKAADAVTIGNHIYLGRDSFTPSIMAHEMTHVAQANLPGPPAEVSLREREASASESSFTQGLPLNVELPGSANEPMTHPAARILLRAGAWLLRRTTRSITKHIARHGRRIAGRAVHSIFRNPRAIRDLTSRAIREGTALAQRATRHGADEILEEGGVRVFRQATRTPGKFRYVLEKDFGREIGTQGERILRLIIDETGRLVTAFPVDRFMAMGLAAGAVTIFGEHTANATERVRERIEAEENRPTDWVGEIIDFLNPLSGGSLNEGEDLELDIYRIITDTTNQVIREIEETEHVTLDPAQRQAIRDLVEVGVGSPLELENIEED